MSDLPPGLGEPGDDASTWAHRLADSQEGRQQIAAIEALVADGGAPNMNNRCLGSRETTGGIQFAFVRDDGRIGVTQVPSRPLFPSPPQQA
jgi:hypothetical protein